MRTQLVMLGLLAFSACGGDPASYQNRDPQRHNRAQLDRDLYECDRENTSTVATTMFGQAVMQPDADSRMAARCLRAWGWSRVK